MAPNIPEVRYLACWTEDDGIYTSTPALAKPARVGGPGWCGPNTTHYEICWVGEDGLYGCGHKHPSVADAVRYMAPSGRCFIRACESGTFRSLSEDEFIAFLAALREMPWKSSH